MLIPVTAIIPTANRPEILKRTLESLSLQHSQPAEIVVIDASENHQTKLICENAITCLLAPVSWRKAAQKGAAPQRNQGIEMAGQSYVFFFDDDILFEEDCIERMWNVISANDRVGGVNAMITNQQYHLPGKATQIMYLLLSGKKLATYAGKCIGPAWNLLPEDRPELPESVEVEWLNTTCAIYRKKALPQPAFPDLFQGYSLMEDLALSLEVGKKWTLLNVRIAKIFHNSQPGNHKENVRVLAKMEMINRHYIMTKILGRKRFSDYLKLLLFECWGMVPFFFSIAGLKKAGAAVVGKFQACASLLFAK